VGAAKAGIAPEECIVFEDSYQGLDSGRAAGCKVVGLSTTNPAEAVAARADVVAPSLQELSNCINRVIGM